MSAFAEVFRQHRRSNPFTYRAVKGITDPNLSPKLYVPKLHASALDTFWKAWERHLLSPYPFPFIFILGDTGVGKTQFLNYLAYRGLKKPVGNKSFLLIELRLEEFLLDLQTKAERLDYEQIAALRIIKSIVKSLLSYHPALPPSLAPSDLVAGKLIHLYRERTSKKSPRDLFGLLFLLTKLLFFKGEKYLNNFIEEIGKLEPHSAVETKHTPKPLPTIAEEYSKLFQKLYSDVEKYFSNQATSQIERELYSSLLKTARSRWELTLKNYFKYFKFSEWQALEVLTEILEIFYILELPLIFCFDQLESATIVDGNAEVTTNLQRLVSLMIQFFSALESYQLQRKSQYNYRPLFLFSTYFEKDILPSFFRDRLPLLPNGENFISLPLLNRNSERDAVLLVKRRLKEWWQNHGLTILDEDEQIFYPLTEEEWKSLFREFIAERELTPLTYREWLNYCSAFWQRVLEPENWEELLKKWRQSHTLERGEGEKKAENVLEFEVEKQRRLTEENPHRSEENFQKKNLQTTAKKAKTFEVSPISQPELGERVEGDEKGSSGAKSPSPGNKKKVERGASVPLPTLREQFLTLLKVIEDSKFINYIYELFAKERELTICKDLYLFLKNICDMELLPSLEFVSEPNRDYRYYYWKFSGRYYVGLCTFYTNRSWKGITGLWSELESEELVEFAKREDISPEQFYRVFLRLHSEVKGRLPKKMEEALEGKYYSHPLHPSESFRLLKFVYSFLLKLGLNSEGKARKNLENRFKNELQSISPEFFGNVFIFKDGWFGLSEKFLREMRKTIESDE